MAHKTKVGGTAYNTKGGKCLVGGTAYSIKKGRTMVGGTGYDVSFFSFSVVVDITAIISVASVTIRGTKYTAVTSGIGAVNGDIITIANTTGDRIYIEHDNKMQSFDGGSADWTIPAGVSRVSIGITDMMGLVRATITTA